MTPTDSRSDRSISQFPELPLLHFRESPRACSYLPQETASLEYRYLLHLDAQTYQQYLERGWRRFGRVIFRPQCSTCRECRSLRVDVSRFVASKSQRRCLSRNEDVTVRIQPATVSQAHVELFNAYHRDMHQRRNWPVHNISMMEYRAEFADPNVGFAHEMLYFRGGDLVGVGLVDVLTESLSSVYFYHAPDWRPLGPGTFSILKELQWAAERGLPYVYLGYWIERCPSMTYKSRFGPHELLTESVAMDQTPDWQLPAPPLRTAESD